MISDSVRNGNELWKPYSSSITLTIATCYSPKTNIQTWNMKMIAAIVTNTINRRRHSVPLSDFISAAPHNACLCSTAVVHHVPNVSTKVLSFSNYLSSMCMGQVPTTTASWVHNYQSLPMADNAEVTVSSYVQNCVQLYLANDLGA